MKKNNNISAFNQILMLVMPFVFYMIFFFVDGYVICADSNSYIDMSFTREPLYPLYLAFFRMFPGESDTYLYLAVFGQSLFAAYAAWNVARYLSSRFNLNSLYVLGITALPLMSSLLCRYAAKRSSMYSNSIMTEGITISLYLLFIRYILEYITEKTKKSLIISCVIVFAAISMRKQMYVLLFLLIVAYIYTNKPVKQTLVRALLIGVILIGGFKLLDCSYNLALRGQFTTHKDAGRFPTTIAMYAAEEEYVEYIEDAELKNVYLRLYGICASEGWLMHSAPSDWLGAVGHFADHYDNIQLDTMETILTREIADINYKKGELQDIERIDIIEKEFRNALLPHEIPKLLKIFINNFLSGLVLTVAKKSSVLTIYAIIAFIVYIALMIAVLLKARGNSKSASHYRLVAAGAFAAITLLSILANVGLVSMVIFCQTRYTIYNLALFYMAGLIMVKVLLETRKRN